MKIGKDMRPLAAELRALGCSFSAGGSHIGIFYKGRRVGTMSVSNSDHRAMKNLRSDLRKNGVPL